MTTAHITIHSTPHATDLMSDTAHECPGCRRMAYWWTNREGRTTCVSCALAQEEAVRDGLVLDYLDSNDGE